MTATVLKNFEIPPKASGAIKAKCKHCGTIILGTCNTKTTSNSITHMKICEQIVIFKLLIDFEADLSQVEARFLKILTVIITQ